MLAPTTSGHHSGTSNRSILVASLQYNNRYFRSQIFYVRNFRVTIFPLFHVCTIYLLHIILLVNIHVKNFRCFGWNENFLTMNFCELR